MAEEGQIPYQEDLYGDPEQVYENQQQPNEGYELVEQNQAAQPHFHEEILEDVADEVEAAEPIEPVGGHEYYEQQQVIQQPPAAPVFHPAEYRRHEVEEDDDDLRTGSPGRPERAEGAEDNAFQIEQEDGDLDIDEMTLKKNFFLPYSDHNYDPYDPALRVEQDEEGPFPVLEGLDENGHIVRVRYPDGYEHLLEEGDNPIPSTAAAASTTPVAAVSGQRQRYPQQPAPHQDPSNLLQYQTTPPNPQALPSAQQQQQRHHNARPTMTAAPYSIGGNPVEYGDQGPPPPPQRRQMAPLRGDSNQHQQRYQVYNDGQQYGANTILAIPNQTLVGGPRGMNARIPPQGNGPPAPQAAAIIRGGPPGGGGGVVRGIPDYGGSPRGNVLPQQQRVAPHHPTGTPGSYQHLTNSVPGGGTQRRLPTTTAPIAPRGGVMNNMPPGRQVGRSLPQPRGGPQNTQIVDMQEREFAEHPLPLGSTGSPFAAGARRNQDMAPHRMSQEQRNEQLRQRSVAGTIAPQPQQQQPPIRRAPAMGHVIGSPQRVTLEPRKMTSSFKVTDSYSTPIPKASDQLPAQLIEDPDEQPSTSGPPPVPKEEPMDVVEPQQQQQAQEEQPKMSPIKSPMRSVHSSPVKQTIQQQMVQKPTPPHRLAPEEKSAHLAKLTAEKEKQMAQQAAAAAAAGSTTPGASTSSAGASSSSSHHHPIPAPLALRLPHQDMHDNPLAMVQSACEKPRGPETPRDKAEISKIVDDLRNEAHLYLTKGPDRQRTLSGGRGGYPIHPQQQQMHGGGHLHHQDPMAERKRLSSSGGGRFDNMNLQGQRIPPHLQNVTPAQESQRHRHPEAGDEPPHRQRGRPRGSGNRFQQDAASSSATRAAGGARTLPPRGEPRAAAVAQPRGNPQHNSDSESEGLAEESWEMRCHCGMDHGDGETVECEQCKTWQHMACMGIKSGSNTDGYKCEMCKPRRLPLTKEAAQKQQRKILKDLIKATEKDKRKQRKSDGVVDQQKKIAQQQPSTSRKSLPNPLPIVQQQQPVARQMNDYSKQALILLQSLERTAGADTLLEESRRIRKARRMFVAEDVEALVTTEIVAIRQVILEMNGHITMANEVKRTPGGGNFVFMYDGLMKGTTGEDVGSGQELVCIDTKRKGNDTRFTRRSCQPNCVLKHVLGQNATLGVMVVATKDINRNVEVTLPFDADWRDSNHVLDCADHKGAGVRGCPFEMERKRLFDERTRKEQTEQRNADVTRERDAERKRLEEEVRRERAEKTRKLDEEARKEEARKKKEQAEKEKALKKEQEKERKESEQKRLEQLRMETEQKAEAMKKQKEQEAGRKTQEEPASSSAPGTSSKTEGGALSQREEKKLKQNEEQFRRKEEEDRKKEMKTAALALQSIATSSTTDNVPSTSTPSSSAQLAPTRPTRANAGRKRKDSDSSMASSSSLNRGPRGVSIRDTPISAAADSTTDSGRKRGAMDTPPAGAKRHRASTVADSTFTQKTPGTSGKKRGAPESSSTTPNHPQKPKKTKSERPDIKVKDFEESFSILAQTSKGFGNDYVPKDVKATEGQYWVQDHRNPNHESYRKEEEAEKKKKKKSVAPQAPLEPKKEREESAEPSIPVAPVSSTTDTTAPVVAAPEANPAPPTPQEKPKKKLSLDDYKNRKQLASTDGGASSSSSTAPGSSGPRRGFIPSTEGTDLANVQLLTLDLPSSTSSTVAPPQSTGAPLPTRQRGESSSADEGPVEHKMSLSARVQSVFAHIPGLQPAAPPPPPPPQQAPAYVAPKRDDAIPPPPPPRPSSRTYRSGESRGSERRSEGRSEGRSNGSSSSSSRRSHGGDSRGTRQSRWQ